MESRLDEVLVLPFDLVELTLGEFFASDPESVLTWMDHATAYAADKAPKSAVSIVNHVGNYENLWIDFRDEKNLFFHHLPKHADSRLINSVHTVYFFDLFRPWGGYGRRDFELHHDFLLD